MAWPMPMLQAGTTPLGLGMIRTTLANMGQLKQWKTVQAEMPEGFSKSSDVAVVIVPGWLSDVSQYRSTAAHLRSRGFATTVVPLKWYNWIPSLGGRSVRPILDRIDATISVAQRGLTGDLQEVDLQQNYKFTDFLREFVNPKDGAQPLCQPTFEFDEDNLAAGGNPGPITDDDDKDATATRELKKVILVAHSAGGWISRILLGRKVEYDGRIYAAAFRVKGLITLGTPHTCTDKLTKRNMDFVNTHYPGTVEKEVGVQYVCVAGKAIRGVSKYGGIWKDFVYQSYELCCGTGDVWGDGVTPVECAIALEGADHIVLEGVEHFPANNPGSGRQWYGSPEVVNSWIPCLHKIVEQTRLQQSVITQ